MPISEDEYIQAINQYLNDSVQNQARFRKVNEDNFRRYNGDLSADLATQKNKSNAISNDAFDVVEADMPSLVRTFLGPDKVLKFQPVNSGNEQDVLEAEQKTIYVDRVIRDQKGAFKTIHDWMKDAEIQEFSAVKYYMEPKESKTRETWRGLSKLEAQAIIADFEEQAESEDTDIHSIEVLDEDLEKDDDIDLNISVTRVTEEIRVTGIPTENFLITRDAATKEDAILVGDQTYMSKGEIVAMGIDGWDADRVSKLTPAADPNGNTMRDLRFRDQGGDDKAGSTSLNNNGSSQTTDEADWCSQRVLVQNLYIKIDKSGNGSCERRYVMKVGVSDILIDEPFDHVPYAIMSAILMPHSAIGKSRVDIVKNTQLEKSIIKRGIYNNIAQVNNPRTAVNTNKDVGRVNIDDLLSNKIRGIVRVDGQPQANLMPLETPYIGDKALQVLQYVDLARAQTTGSLMASQGLNQDSLNDETATRFEGVQGEGAEKTELVMRVFAETGFKDLYEGVAWLASRYQDAEKEIKILGQPLMVNPTDWRFEHCCVSNVGIAAGDSEEMTANMGIVMNTLERFKAQGSRISDESKIYNAFSKVLKSMGVRDVSEFANDPTIPQETLQAENEQLKAQLEQIMPVLQQMQQQNPLTEAEVIKAESKAESDNKRLMLEEAKINNDNKQFILEMQQKQDQFLAKLKQDQEKMRQDFVKFATEAELKSGEDVRGSVV